MIPPNRRTSIALVLFALVNSMSIATCSAAGTLDSSKKAASLPRRADPFLPASKPVSDGALPPVADFTNQLLSDDNANSQATMIDKGVDVSTIVPDKQLTTRKLYDSPLARNVLFTFAGFAVAFATCVFAKYFPYVLTPTASKAVYQPASFNYDPALSFFDNTAWTYATNYANMAVMLSIVASILKTSGGLQRRAAGLLICYAASVGAGAIAHSTFLTLASRNTLTFRLLWTVCVGTVTLAGGFMGACGSQVAKLSGGKYYISEWFWAGFGCFTTAVCAAGNMSFQRPACDIFVAGITQTLPTIYICLLSIFQMKNSGVSAMARYSCVVGFVLLVPLLPLYAVLVYHTDWSLARINAFLHFCLCLAWSTQGLALRHFSRAANNQKIEV